MEFTSSFSTISVDEVLPVAQSRKDEGWRYVQMLCVNTEDGIDAIYTYEKEGRHDNLTVKGVKKGTHIASVSSLYMQAFVFENEAHDLFGIEIDDIVIDFKGKFYDVTVNEPMTVISPAQKAARDKAAKIAAAKAAKEKGAAAQDDDIEAKLAGMDPEKAAKVRAAMEAKAKKEAATKKDEMEDKLAGMDPEKAAKVRAALEAKAAREAAKKEAE